MARASIRTLLPLDTWAKVLGIDPWEFNQIGVFPKKRSNAQCTHVFFQTVSSQDFIAREEIAEKISQAEQMIADQLDFWPAPKYFVDERVQYPRPHQRYLFGGSGTERGEWKTVETRWKKFISGGLFNRTLIAAGVAVTRADLDADGVFESFSLPATATTVTDVSEIAIYFTSADRLTAPLEESWRIRPINVAISGGNVTVSGHAAQLVKPVLTETLYPANLDASDAATYVTTVDLYRVFTDNEATVTNPNQGVAIWNVLPPKSTTGAISILPLTLAESDNANGMPFATFGASSTWPFNREPDRLQACYVAGLALDAYGHMDYAMAQTITYLSVSLLATEKCGCERSNRIIDKWRKPLTEDDARVLYTPKELEENPFSAIPNQGSLYAWKQMKRWRHIAAVGI